jgi:hypothetical protein
MIPNMYKIAGEPARSRRSRLTIWTRSRWRPSGGMRKGGQRSALKPRLPGSRAAAWGDPQGTHQGTLMECACRSGRGSGVCCRSPVTARRELATDGIYMAYIMSNGTLSGASRYGSRRRRQPLDARERALTASDMRNSIPSEARALAGYLLVALPSPKSDPAYRKLTLIVLAEEGCRR